MEIKYIFLYFFKKKKKFEIEPFIYLDMFNNPSFYPTNKTFKLKKFIIIEFSKNEAIKKAIIELNNNYPHLKGKIKIL